MRTDYDKIMKVVEDLKQRQALSDELETLIRDITDSTNTDGEIELEITRTKKKFTLDANLLSNRLTNQKDANDAKIDAIISKITVNGK